MGSFMQEHQQNMAAAREAEQQAETQRQEEQENRQHAEIEAQLGVELAHDDESEEEEEDEDDDGGSEATGSRTRSRNASELVSGGTQRVVEPKIDEKQLSKKVLRRFVRSVCISTTRRVSHGINLCVVACDRADVFMC
jgi:hypothetical protein